MKIGKDMGVIRKFAFSLLMVATLGHGQLSVDLNRGNKIASLQHFPENIDGTGLQDPTTNSKNLHSSTTKNQSTTKVSI